MPRKPLTLIANAVTAEVRRETKDGKSFLVTPMVALVPKVLRCSTCDPVGELVSLREIARSLHGWNGRPVTLNHPEDGEGRPILANTSQEVFESVKVGEIWNADIEGVALTFEVWVDEARALEMTDGAEVVAALEAGTMLEISTGYVADRIEVTGTFNNQTYGWEQVGIIPDHVAILTGQQVGACSIEDGCGTPRLNQSDHDRRSMLQTALTQMLGDEDTWLWVEDVFSDEGYLVYEIEVRDDPESGGRFRVTYEIADGGEVTFGERQKVRRVTTYEPVANAGSPDGDGADGAKPAAGQGPVTNSGADGGNSETPREPAMKVNRKALLKALTDADSVTLDRAALEESTDEELVALAKSHDVDCGCISANEGGDDSDGGDAAEDDAEDGEPGEEPAAGDVTANAMTSEEVAFLRDLRKLGSVKDIAALMRAGKEARANEDAERDAIVGRLAANKAVKLERADLKGLPLKVLRGMERTVSPQDFTGIAAHGSSVLNGGDDGESFNAPVPVVTAAEG